MRAFITGVTGQDGYYLSKLLKEKGYTVFGGYRRSSKFPDHLPDVEPIPIEMTEYESISRAIRSCLVDEVYNLAAQSHVGESFNCPEYTQNVNGTGVLRILEVLRGSKIRMYQASTSEMFGNSSAPQNERTAFDPRSPYAASKVYGHQISGVYRKAYGIKVSCGILFNHESPLRGKDFVTRKITSSLAAHGTVILGDLNTKRDWGHARDYMEAAWMMLQRDPDDFVIGTGKSNTVGDFLNEARKYLPCHAVVEGPRRPLDVAELRADYTKAHMEMNWNPKTSFAELVREMCESELQELGLPRQDPMALACQGQDSMESAA